LRALFWCGSRESFCSSSYWSCTKRRHAQALSQGAGRENELDEELEIMASPVKKGCVICGWMQKAVMGASK